MILYYINILINMTENIIYRDKNDVFRMKVTTISIEEDLLQWCRDNYINISAFTRGELRKLRDKLRKIENE